MPSWVLRLARPNWVIPLPLAAFSFDTRKAAERIPLVTFLRGIAGVSGSRPKNSAA